MVLSYLQSTLTFQLIPTSFTWQTVLTLIAAVAIGYLVFRMIDSYWKRRVKPTDVGENVRKPSAAIRAQDRSHVTMDGVFIETAGNADGVAAEDDAEVEMKHSKVKRKD